MRFIVTKNKLDNIISSMQPFLEKKDASSITSHIYLEVNERKLNLKATDYEIGLEYTIDDLEESTNGKATVNGANILGIIKRLKDNDIIIEVIDNNLVIKQNKSIFKLPMYDANEYPSFVNIANLKTLGISTSNIINSFKKITPAVDNNNPKFELNGSLIDIKQDKINFVATDTRRLAVSTITNMTSITAQIIIPKKAMIEIQKLFVEENEANVYYDENNLVISTANKTFFTKLINGKFPDYTRIIPSQLNQEIMIAKNILVESIKLVTSLYSNIKISFNTDSIIFESLDENTESKTQVDINLNIQKSFYLAVNAKYLLDFLSICTKEEIKIGFNDSNLPFYLEDEKFFTIIMPIVLNK